MSREILTMSKYKINIDKAPPSDEMIERHKKKSFDNMLTQYQNLHDMRRLSKPLYKDKKLLSLLMLIFIVLLAIIFTHNEKEEPKTPNEKQQTPLTDDSLNTESQED